MSEEQLQKIIAKYLEDNDGNIENLITEASISAVLKQKKEEYGLNEVVSQRYIRSVEHIIKLMGNGTILCDTGKINISMNSKEKIQPDFVIYIEENDVYQIIELKISGNAERQAVTEVTAYQAELMNYLPGLSYNHFPIIIISQDYKPLLKHSISSLLMSNQIILCLSVNMTCLDKGDTEFLDVVNCCAWKDIKWRLTKDSLHGQTICFYANHSNFPEHEMDKILSYGAQLVCEEAEKSKGNGLVIAWKRNKHDNSYDAVYTDYFLSYFSINPYANYISTGTNTVIDKNIKEVINESAGMTSLYPDSFLSDKMRTLYKDEFSLHIEGHMTIEDFLYAHEDCQIIKVMYWGLVNEFITDSLLHNPLFKPQSVTDLYADHTYFENLVYLFDERLNFESTFAAFKMGMLDEQFMNKPQKKGYEYASYVYSKQIWDKMAKDAEQLRLYNCGRKYQCKIANGENNYSEELAKCYETLCRWHSEKTILNEADEFIIENCIIAHNIIEYVIQKYNLDEDNDYFDEQVENLEYETFTLENKRKEKISETIKELNCGNIYRLIESRQEEMAFLCFKYSTMV